MAKNVINNRVLIVIFGMSTLFISSPLYAVQRKKQTTDSIAQMVLQKRNITLPFLSTKSSPIRLCMSSSQLFGVEENISKTHEAFYIYTQDMGKGFVIVSGDDRMAEVLAFSNTEIFDKENIPSSVLYWLRCYVSELNCLDSCDADVLKGRINKKNIHPEGISPLLGDLWWGQGSPYNKFCPLKDETPCVVGCVATAMSQVMFLYRWPDCGQGDIQYKTLTHQIEVKRNLSDYPLQWDLMKNQYVQGYYTEEEGDAVASLMASCGAAVYMDYSLDASGAYQHDLLRAFIRNFNYDPDAAFLQRDLFTEAIWHQFLLTELNEGRAVNYAGQSKNDGGHSFVIDGYTTNETDDIPYYHINWGWNGLCNGYYQLSRLLPMQDGKNYTEKGYCEGQQMLIGIKPEDNIMETTRLLWAEKLRLLVASLSPGEVAHLQISELGNLSYREFDGTLDIVLRDSSGNNYVIAQEKINPLPYLSSHKDLSLNIKIPENTPIGEYSLLVGTHSTDGVFQDVYTTSDIKLTIVSTSNEDLEPCICVSEVEMYKQKYENCENLALKLYEISNIANNDFEGYINIEITTPQNERIPISEFFYLGLIEAKDIIDNPIELYAIIPESLPIGDYPFHIVYKTTENDTAYPIMIHDPYASFLDPIPYEQILHVYENEFSICGISFLRSTTSLLSIQNNKPLANKLYVTPSGIRMKKPSKKGIYIYNNKKDYIK